MSTIFDPFSSPLADRTKHRNNISFTSPTAEIKIEFPVSDEESIFSHQEKATEWVLSHNRPGQSNSRTPPSPRLYSGALSPEAQQSIKSLAETASSPTAYRLAALSTLSRDGAIKKEDKIRLKEKIIMGACPQTAEEVAAGDEIDFAFRKAAREGQSAPINEMLMENESKRPVSRSLQFSALNFPSFATHFDRRTFICSPLPKYLGMMKLRVLCLNARKGPFFCYHEASGRVILEAYFHRSFMDRYYRIYMHVEDLYIDEVHAKENRREDGGHRTESLGRLRTKTSYIYLLHDDGEKPGKAAGVMTVREEHGLFVYERKLARAPRNLTSILPNVNYREGCRTCVRPMRSSESLEALWAGGKPKPSQLNNRGGSGRILALRQRQPSYNQERKNYSLDFHGRCRFPSEKNFMLVDPFDDLQTVVLFGAMTEAGKEFSLDLCFPCSIFQVFGMALSQLDSASWTDVR